LHIWADAQLKFDVTKQDNVLPLSYPATANSFLAKYNLLDLQQFKQDKADRLHPTTNWQTSSPLICQTDAEPAFRIFVVPTLSAAIIEQWQQQGFVRSEQHFAPVQSPLALLNLVYGAVELNDSTAQLALPPAWLAQQHQVTIAKTGDWPQQLPWLHREDASQAQLVFVADETQLSSLVQPDQASLILPLQATNPQFELAPVPLLVRWKGWPEHRLQPVTQHLDLVPTLLWTTGCRSHWAGDVLQQPSPLPKLNLSRHQLISFKKDKMTVVRDDGSFGVWSAGTLVPLNEKMDLPMLTDALKRIKAQ